MVVGEMKLDNLTIWPNNLERFHFHSFFSSDKTFNHLKRLFLFPPFLFPPALKQIEIKMNALTKKPFLREKGSVQLTSSQI